MLVRAVFSLPIFFVGGTKKVLLSAVCKSATRGVSSSSSSAFPSYISEVHLFGSDFWVCYRFFTPAIEVVTFHLRGRVFVVCVCMCCVYRAPIQCTWTGPDRRSPRGSSSRDPVPVCASSGSRYGPSFTAGDGAPTTARCPRPSGVCHGPSTPYLHAYITRLEPTTSSFLPPDGKGKSVSLFSVLPPDVKGKSVSLFSVLPSDGKGKTVSLFCVTPDGKGKCVFVLCYPQMVRARVSLFSV